MMHFYRHKNIGLAILASFFLFMVVKASTPYTVSVTSFNDTEFPRVQVALKISGVTQGLLSRHIRITEGGKENMGPRVFLPPGALPSKMELHVLIDTSGRVSTQEGLVRANLESLFQYIFDSGMTAAINIKSFDGSQTYSSNDLQGALNNLSSLTFSDGISAKIDGFGQISAAATATGSGQRVLLVVNGSDFEDNKTDGVSGDKMRQAVSTVSANDYLTFVLGHPLRKLHAVKANSKIAGLDDFSHAVPGGYLGGFGADLTSIVDLLKMRSASDFVLQYYSTLLPGSFAGAQAILSIEDSNAYNFTYGTLPTSQIAINHLPANELVLGEEVVIDVDLGHYGKMVNAVELNYKDKDDVFRVATLRHERGKSTDASLRYTGRVAAEVMDDKNFSYYVSVHTPYSSVGDGSGLVTVPVNAYDNGIILKATLVNNSEVLWSWEGPTVVKGKSFEVWSGDTLLTTTNEKHHTIPLNNCNRYQIIQVKVIFPDGTKSYPSRPYEYFAETEPDAVINEKNGVMLMIECIENKEIETYTKIAANTPGFNAAAYLTLERAGIYLAKIIAEDIWKKIESQSGYYELLYYIMIFIDREEYQTHGMGDQAINESLVYKLITKVNHTDDINEAYNKALEEISNRLRSTLSM